MVHCAKLNEELEGLDFTPFPNELGQRIYDHVSKEAWQMWINYSVMVINEYRLNLATPEGQEVYDRYLENFFFGEDAASPQDTARLSRIRAGRTLYLPPSN